MKLKAKNSILSTKLLSFIFGFMTFLCFHIFEQWQQTQLMELCIQAAEDFNIDTPQIITAINRSPFQRLPNIKDVFYCDFNNETNSLSLYRPGRIEINKKRIAVSLELWVLLYSEKVGVNENK